MKSIITLTFLGVAMVIIACWTPARGQTVTNILDTFDRNGTLVGSAPDIADTNSLAANWTVEGSSWNTTNLDGGELIVDTTEDGLAKLNFTPQIGYVYTISLIQNILGPVGTTDRWGMIGFDNGSATSQPYTASGPWMLVKYSGRLESYFSGTSDDIFSADNAGNAAGTNNLLQIVLNTALTNWQAQIWLNGVEEGVTDLPGGWQINQVMIGSYGALTMTNQIFSVVRESVSGPLILSQPVGFTNQPGGVGSLSVGAYGAPPLYYQWQDNGLPIAGATNSSLLFDDLQSSDSGAYRVIVSGSAGSVTSSVANVLVQGSIFAGSLPATGTDAASGINATNTYLCALTFGSDTAPLAINGLNFQPVALAGAGAGLDKDHPAFSGTDSFNGGTWSLAGDYTGGLGVFSTNVVQSQADGGFATLLGNYTALAGTVAANSSLTLTCGGLVPGGQYALRLYYAAVGSGTPVNFTFNGSGYAESYSANPVNLDSGGALFVEYDFAAAGSNVIATVAAAESGGLLRIQGATLQIVQASPAVSDAALISDAAEAGAIIAASDAAQATTNWSAHWISPARASLNEWLCYRKTFSLPQQPTTAVARIAVDSKYWLWVNGQMVVREGELKRGPTPADTWYDAIDLAPYLQSGSNTIAILQWYFGKSGESHLSSGVPGLIFEMDAGDTTLLSDATWRMKTNSAYQLASAVPQPPIGIPESSIRYDARLDLGAWTNANYDDSGWSSPIDNGPVGNTTWGKLWLRPMTFWSNAPLQNFVSTNLSGTTWTCQLPANLQFTPWLDVDAPTGEVITVRGNADGGGSGALEAEYVTTAGRQSFEFPAWMNGDQALFNVPAGVTVYGLKFRPHLANCQIFGSFSCDDPSLVTLWQKAANTLRVDMADTWMDCADRERANWIGDVSLDVGEAAYVFDPRVELTARKSLLDLVRWQRSDLTLYAPVPIGADSYGELPAQSLAAVGNYGMLRYYQNTGDLAFLQQCYPAVKSYLLDVWQTNSVGLVVHRNGDWDWYDWGGNIDDTLLDNTWYYFACEAGAQMASLVGQPADAPLFASRAEGISNEFNASFWTGSAYRTPTYSGGTDERGNAMAVLAGFTNPTQTPALENVLTTDINAGPYMEKYVLEALFALGDPDDALNRMRSRYSSMINASPSTLWEYFPDSGTFNHAWSGGPLTVMTERLLGLRRTSPGFATFDVQPVLGTTLTRANLDVPSQYGLIRIATSRSGSNNKLSVRVPPGTTGRAIQPTDGGPLSGAILSIDGGVTATIDETVIPAQINLLDGNATLQSAVSGSGRVAKTGIGTLNIADGGALTAGAFSVCQGQVTVSAGGQLVVSGGFTNNGTLLLTGGAQLNVGGPFVNNGVLDMITWNGTLPADFVNNGVLLDRSSDKVRSCAVNGMNFGLTIMGYAGHTYQLQQAEDLNSGAWTNIGSAQTGGGSPLTFTQTNALANGRSFYRVLIFP